MKPGFCHILGTDTNVGKTYVTNVLLEICQGIGINALPLKPIHSGWDSKVDLGEDLSFHQNVLGDELHRGLCCYALEAPMSPHRAADLESVHISIDKLNQFLTEHFHSTSKFHWVEGIGGVCCPISKNLTYLELIKNHLGPVVLVSRVGLGSLNHSIMSARILEKVGLEVDALILNEEQVFDASDPIVNSAKWELEQQLTCPIIGPLKRNERGQHLKMLAPLVEKLVHS